MPQKDRTSQSPTTLPFNFVPQEPETAVENNPHEKATTRVDAVISALKKEFTDAIGETIVYAGERTVRVDADRIVDVCVFLKDQQGFNYLSDIGGIDRFTEDDRYEIFYNLVDLNDSKRIRLVIRLDEDDLSAPTVTGVYPAANWNERECYDMFGITFDRHPDLRRMFMPEDFEYFPLRKEFPLLGIPGSLPLPPQEPTGELTMDPFAAAHGSKPPKSFEEVQSTDQDEG